MSILHLSVLILHPNLLNFSYTVYEGHRNLPVLQYHVMGPGHKHLAGGASGIGRQVAPTENSV